MTDPASEPIQSGMISRSNPSLVRLGTDAGFLMIEVIVSAAMLLVISLSVMMTLSQNDRLAGQQARRAIAANIAESEIERVRSLPIEDVAQMNGTVRAVSEANTDFSVASTSKWVTDGSDEPECTTRSGGLDYMRVTTRVTWAGMNNNLVPGDTGYNRNAVSLSSIVTPSARSASTTAGSLSVHITRADGVTGAPGIVVKIEGDPTGPTAQGTTNANGCVVFPFVNAQDYTLSFQKTGWVDQDSVSAVEDQVKVTGGQTAKYEYMYDRGGWISSARFVTSQDGDEYVPSTNVSTFTIFHPEQKNPAPLPFDNQNGTANTWNGTAKLLFPFSTPYAIYAGGYCNGVNAPTSGGTFVNIPVGGPQGAGAVRLPSYDVVVFSGSTSSPGSRVGGAKVVFNTGCGANIAPRLTETGGTNSAGVSLLGRLKDPGFPWTTTGSVCVSGTAANGTTRKITRSVVDTAANMSANPGPQQFYLSGVTAPNASTAGAC